MIRILLILFSIIVFSVILEHFTLAKAQETGTLSVTTTPVSGAIYVDFVFKGTKFWSGDLRVLYSLWNLRNKSFSTSRKIRKF
jgi:hypothetical protein